MVLHLYYSNRYYSDRPRRDRWDLDEYSAFLGRFLKVELDMDWYGSPDEPGLLHFKSSVESNRNDWRHPRRYIDPRTDAT